MTNFFFSIVTLKTRVKDQSLQQSWNRFKTVFCRIFVGTVVYVFPWPDRKLQLLRYWNSICITYNRNSSDLMAFVNGKLVSWLLIRQIYKSKIIEHLYIFTALKRKNIKLFFISKVRSALLLKEYRNSIIDQIFFLMFTDVQSTSDRTFVHFYSSQKKRNLKIICLFFGLLM